METFVNNGMVNVTTVWMQQSGSEGLGFAEFISVASLLVGIVQLWQGWHRDAQRPQGAALG